MKALDLTGKVFGRLTVLHRARSVKTRTGGYTMWRCRCVDGNCTDVRTQHLTSGRIVSCGCYLKEVLDLVPRGLDPGRSHVRSIYNYYSVNAVKRGLLFDLTFEQFCGIISQNCHYCGQSPELGHNNQRRWGSKSMDYKGVVKYNGVDRLDNSKGYEIGNVCPCCKRCNYAKRDMTIEEFSNWVSRLTQHFNLAKPVVIVQNPELQLAFI